VAVRRIPELQFPLDRKKEFSDQRPLSWLNPAE
jgi:hypothetical protein